MRLGAHPDNVTIAVPAGLRLRSAADRGQVDDGIALFARAAAGPQRPVALTSVPSGHWVAHKVPGVPRDVADDPASWPGSAKPYRFTADDPAGRFLPLRFTSPLPARGTLHWSGWNGWSGARRNRARPILPPGATASTIPDYLPLFPGPGWRSEPGLADVRAQLAIRETGGALRNAGWTIVTIGIVNTVIGLGVADGEGRLVVAFPYPAMPQQTPIEAAQGRPKIAWQVRVRVYCRELAVGLDQGVAPELQDILAQLDGPPIHAMRTVMGSQPDLPDQEMVLGQTLVLRTEVGGGKLSSSLFLKST